MSSKSDLAARAQRLRQRREPAVETAAAKGDRTAPDNRTAAVPRVKPVRVTTDLPPQTHRALTAMSVDLAQQLGVARVPHSDIVRALLAELETDPQLQRKVCSRLRSVQ